MLRLSEISTVKSLDATRRQRSGVAVLWLIASAPAILLFLCVMVEVANIWNARVKLEVALESAALAGVKTWAELTEADTVPAPHDSPGEFAKTSAARDAAVAAAAANNVAGMSIVLDRNEADDGLNDVGYDNANCTGDLILGGFPTTGATDFNVTAAVGCGRSTVPDEDFAVLAQQTLSVNAICNNLFGIPVGPFTVSGRAVATARCAGANSTVVNNPLLVHVTGVTCP